MSLDTVIIGGGPAGCSAALSLRAKGYSVAIVDGPLLREKPTETAGPELRRFLQSLGAEQALSACEPCHGISSNWGRPTPILRSSIFNPHGHAWFIHRRRFDSNLRQIAIDKGTEWIKGIARDVDFGDNAVSVKTEAGQILRGKWLIAANGSPIWPARITQQKPATIDSLIAFWAHLPVTFNEQLLLVEASEYGWWYLCRADEAGVIACLITDHQSAKELQPSHGNTWNDLFQATKLSERLSGRISTPLVHIASTGIAHLPRRSGHQWIAIGDAAMKLDPLGSSGVLTALDSGHRASEGISKALQGNVEGLHSYDRWSYGLFNEFLRQRESHYVTEASRRTGLFWNRRMPKVTWHARAI
jgi:flavin-dependent dehydrogenase